MLLGSVGSIMPALFSKLMDSIKDAAAKKMVIPLDFPKVMLVDS